MKKTFDAVTWMRRRRAEIDDEDQGLSWEEKHEKTRRLLEKDPLWLRLKERLVEPTSVPVGTTGGHKDKLSERTSD